MTQPRRTRPPSNFVAEWFGHIVWPPDEVDESPDAIRDQVGERCPFPSSATAAEVACIKKVRRGDSEYRTGFCTASSPSTGVREDWLACPARVFDQQFTLIRAAIVHLFGLEDGDFDAYPLTRFHESELQEQVRAAGEPGVRRVFAFASNPPALGGEIDIPETAQSPGNKVDVSIFEVVGEADGVPELGRFSIFEIQTADFHGSPLHAVGELRTMGPPTRLADYHAEFVTNPDRLGRRIEGPNKANIFKRTIYQMVLKIQMAKDPRCTGFCVVLPEPVWRSWERHLGDPELVADPMRSGVVRLAAPSAGEAEDTLVEREPAWILVFKIDRESDESPRPLKVVKQVATDSAALLHYAFEVAPEAAISEGALDRFAAAFQRRLDQRWHI